MSTELLSLLFISTLAIVAGVFGFVVGGTMEMRKFRKEVAMRKTCGKNSHTLSIVRDRSDAAA